MKKLLLLTLCLFSLVTKAQINPKFYGDPDDFKNLKNKTLIVEVIEEDAKTIKKLSSPKKADELKAYQSFIKEFNTDFKIYVQKYWNLNNKIEYKTVTEIKALKKNKNKSYAVLRFMLLDDIESYGLMSSLNVPAIAYTRIENDLDNPDSKIYLPSNYFSKEKTLAESDYCYALNILQANVNWIIKNNKVLNFDKYAEKMANENVSKLKGKTLLVQENMMMKGRSKDEAKKNYEGDLKFVSDIELNNAVVNKNKNTAVLYSVPYGIIKGSALVVQISRVTFFKVIVDCETGEILWLYMPSAFSYGSNITNQLTEGEFKTMAKGKII